MGDVMRTVDLTKRFPVRRGVFRSIVDHETAVRNVTLSVPDGDVLGVVGESGSGKTTLARLLLRLTSPSDGQIYYRGRRVDTLSQRAFRSYRRRIQVVFQDPMESLDPRYRVDQTIDEGMRHLTDWSRGRRRERIRTLVDQMGLGKDVVDKYPHQLSGGQRQRVGIARALAVRPDLVVCDEPTSALDVSIQAQIINLLLDLKEEYELSYVFISHDLNLVRFVSDRVAVMEAGRVVEEGSAARVYERPESEAARRLVEAASSRVGSPTVPSFE